MKRILSLFIIILLVSSFAIAQETTSVVQTPEESAQPESFFNDLIKSLNPISDSTKNVAKKAEPSEKTLPHPQSTIPTEPTNGQESVDPLIDPVITPKDAIDVPTPVDQYFIDPADENSSGPSPHSAPESPTQPPNEDSPTPSDTPVQQQIVPAHVPTKDIVIVPPADDSKKKKEKKEKIKEEKEKRLFKPYIEVPDPKSKSQKKYVKAMEKLPKSRMRLITLDQADIIHGRKYRSPEYAIQNPANLGVRSEFGSTFSIIPFNTLEIDIKTSTKPFIFMEEYLSTGELLTPGKEDSMIAMLGPNGLELPIEINMPTVVNFKMSILGGSIYANAGLFIKENMRIPGEFFDIILEGATFDDPFQMNENLGMNLTAYAKGSAGYGTFVELPLFLGELRFGGTVNAYAGAFTNLNVTNMELVPSPDGVTVQGTVEALTFADTLSLFGSEGFQFGLVDDYLGIPGITLGYDFGLAWRFKLNRLLPIMPNFIKNYFDFQVGIEDLGASISMNHAYLREINFEMEAGDLLNTFSDGLDLDSMMVLDETLVYADSTISQPLGTKLNFGVNYQPIPQLLLKGGMTQFLSQGLNSNDGQNYYYGVEIYPISSLCLHGTVTQKGNYRYSEAGFKLYSNKSEFGLKVRVYDLDFSFTENVSGAGLQFNWVRYF